MHSDTRPPRPAIPWQQGLAAAMLACAGLPAALANPSLVLTSSASTLSPGQTVTVQLRGEGFATTSGGASIQNVSGGQQVQLAFTAPGLQLQSVTIDPAWNFAAGTGTGTVNNVSGTLADLKFARFPATAGASFPIATLNFKAGNAPADVTVALTSAKMVGRVNNVSGTVIAADLGQLALNIRSDDAGADGDVPIPLWALGLLACGMFWRLGRR